MRIPKPFKIKFIDLDEMKIIEEVHDVYVMFNSDNSTIEAYDCSNDTLGKQLQIVADEDGQTKP